MLFAITLTNLLATILELTIQVYKVHRSIGVQHLEYFEMINDLLRDFSTTTCNLVKTAFRIKLMKFFWEKFFIDKKNILCFYMPLE